MPRGHQKKARRHGPKKRNGTRRDRANLRPSWKRVQWAGWLLFIVAILWIFFGKEVADFFAKAVDDPLSAGHAIVEAFGWVRLATELLLKTIVRRE